MRTLASELASWVISLLIGVGAAVFTYLAVRKEGEESIEDHTHKPHAAAHR